MKKTHTCTITHETQNYISAEVQLRKTVVKPKERPPDEEGGKKNKILGNNKKLLQSV